jgi:hypothetical protein
LGFKGKNGSNVFYHFIGCGSNLGSTVEDRRCPHSSFWTTQAFYTQAFYNPRENSRDERRNGSWVIAHMSYDICNYCRHGNSGISQCTTTTVERRHRATAAVWVQA